MHNLGYLENVVEEVSHILSLVSRQEIDVFVKEILNEQRIFVAGAGRTGLILKGFAMRLMHLGFPVYVVGESTTPGIQKEDLLIIGSGSGETGSLILMAEKAKNLKSKVGIITIFSNSTIGSLADFLIEIPASTPKSALKNRYDSLQPMGSLFEQGLMLICDSMVLTIMKELNSDEEAMFEKHANLE